MTDQIVDLLRPGTLSLVIDCTVGEGGHLEALLDAMGADGVGAGMDRDPEIIMTAAGRLERFGDRARLFTGSYTEIGEVLKMMGSESADGVLFDLGLSSYHLKEPRGFAFSDDSKLDMRFNRSGDYPSAADVVNRTSEAELRDIIGSLGEERRAGRIAGAIVEARRSSPIETTGRLGEIIENAAGRRGRIHPATLTFQALRIYVNSELDHLREVMEVLPGHVRSGGRVAVLSYHSLEDRIVKRAMKAWEKEGTFKPVTRKPVGPDETEIKENPSSRSAKLRVAERN